MAGIEVPGHGVAQDTVQAADELIDVVGIGRVAVTAHPKKPLVEMEGAWGVAAMASNVADAG